MKNSIQILGTLILVLSLSVATYAQHAVIANTKMNVVYIGIDNPIEIAISRYSEDDIRVKVGQGTITGESGKYNWKVTTPGTAEIKVFVVENGQEKEIYSTNYRVKRIPNPVAKVGEGNNVMTVGYLHAQTGVQAVLDNFDFDATCEIESFVLTVIRPQSDPVDVINKGGKFSSQAIRLIRILVPGSTVYIENVKCKCPGDQMTRNINSIVLKVR